MSCQHPLNIVVIGPESTGKSSLCQALAVYYDNLWCPEYARQYLEEKPSEFHYTREDLLVIAKEQLQQEKLYMLKARERNDRFLFIDTDMYVIKVWSEVAFQKCDHWILEQIARRQYDYYLLCDIDLPWTEDPLREYPDPAMRQHLFKHYQDLLHHQNTPFSVIHGADSSRIENAVQALEQQFP
ncbi:AAA family ATPase [Arachidicoccus terrestris]|uniref:AAA family ATPase n=1 Tax=Arachidicoccus terrestris TaxID=2875539 RepID=UPI001CC79068|nr:ATP-binding protein [Arachidicoccus terrestris]UAY54444.1 ATP-binding protein [Arachidicoccus terrestris]